MMPTEFDPGTPDDPQIGTEPTAPDADPSLGWLWFVICVLLILAFTWVGWGWGNSGGFLFHPKPATPLVSPAPPAR